MKGGFGTVVLLAALVIAFAFSWRSAPPREPQRAETVSPRIAAADHRKPPEPKPNPKPKPALSYTYGGYPCASSDCADDKAGYRWAERNVIGDADNCVGTTSEFIEGCRVYVERRRASMPSTT